MSNDPFANQPRSTPIPGVDDPPLTPAQFASGWRTTTPPPPPTPPADHYSTTPFASSPGVQYDPQMIAAQYATAMGAMTMRRSRSLMWFIVLVCVLAPLAIGGYVTYRVMHVVDQATDTSPKIPGGAADLFDPAASADVLDQIDTALPGNPTTFNQLTIYPEYAIGSALVGNDVDGRLWRRGKLTDWPGLPAVAQPGGFTLDDVSTDAIAKAVDAAPLALNDPAADPSYVIVERSSFDDARPLVIMVYVNGGSHYVEADANGTVLATH